MKEVSAGGVVYRRREGSVEILLIEDRYSRWTLPKGKKEPDETIKETALREILEETGVRGRVESPLETIQYTYFDPDRKDVFKTVHYFLVRAESDEVTPQWAEITSADWFPFREAWKLQCREGYDNNRSVLDNAYRRLGLSVEDSDSIPSQEGVFSMNHASLASMIDHTLLKPGTTSEQIDKLCREAVEHRFAAVCINPDWVARAAERLKGTGVKVATVVGFPLGATTREVKAFETRQAIQNGASEIDMVMNIDALKSGDLDYFRQDIEEVVQAAEKAPVKVILETGLLNQEEIRVASEKAKAAGAHFVKTSTGFGQGGATEEAVRLMRETVGPDMGVKASGGIRDRETADKMVAAGANRIGASASVAIVTGGKGTGSY
ncbi:deoxyribose-phosphate aldolase [Paludifilum halophilum]|uniref:Deoxyribose-phosphate aldolase n=2 Tax=Paludifilum halophilum TaxID=1642702 RepID=A0A235B5S8_9BACL|nr:deoxyribose-phosphate aldolase [Paludifilum halophilum]